jgi:hypothetical protein
MPALVQNKPVGKLTAPARYEGVSSMEAFKTKIEQEEVAMDDTIQPKNVEATEE